MTGAHVIGSAVERETAALRRDLDERDSAIAVLAEEVRRVERERDETIAAAADAEAARDRALEERDAAETRLAQMVAIVEGSPRAPTPEEVDAHDGPWIVCTPHSAGYAVKVLRGDEAKAVAARAAQRTGYLWHAWDDVAGRPCARPAIGGSDV